MAEPAGEMGPQVASQTLDAVAREVTASLSEARVALEELRADETVAAFQARLLRDHGVEVPDSMLLSLHQLRVVISA